MLVVLLLTAPGTPLSSCYRRFGLFFFIPVPLLFLLLFLLLLSSFFICPVNPQNCTYKLQANPGDDGARAEDGGGDAGEDDETVKGLGQVEELSSWKKAGLKMSMRSGSQR